MSIATLRGKLIMSIHIIYEIKNENRSTQLQNIPIKIYLLKQNLALLKKTLW